MIQPSSRPPENCNPGEAHGQPQNGDRLVTGQKHTNFCPPAHRRAGRYKQASFDQLPPRIVEVGELVANGLSNTEISQIMGIGIKAVENYIWELMQHYEIPGGPNESHRRVLLAHAVDRDRGVLRIATWA